MRDPAGLGLWLFGYRFGFIWVPLHHASSYLSFVTMAVHRLNYLRRAPGLAIAMLTFPAPFLPVAGGS